MFLWRCLVGVDEPVEECDLAEAAVLEDEAVRVLADSVEEVLAEDDLPEVGNMLS